MTATTVEAPPSTLGELRDVLIDYENSRPRSRQRELGPSEIGTPCRQQIARKLAGAPRRIESEPAWAPFAGTAVHASMEDVLAYWNARLGRERWISEDRLTIIEPLPGPDGEPAFPGLAGSSDAYDTDTDTVVDWKYVGDTKLKKLYAAKRAGKPAPEQIGQDYRIQAHLYGMGQENKGRDVKFVRVVFLARTWKFDDSLEWTEPYRPDVAAWAINRYYDVVSQVAELDLANNPDQITIVPSAPSGDACNFCPFLRPGQPSDFKGCSGTTLIH